MMRSKDFAKGIAIKKKTKQGNGTFSKPKAGKKRYRGQGK
nr:hypothetical protein [uncultured Mediterranean phage uvMED]BAR25526.1 hypothetical protein [uncultured Mediterranean phage uvMED]